MRIGRARINVDEAWLLLHVYRQDAVLYFDFNGCFPPVAATPNDELTLTDFGRILALGVGLDAALVSKGFAAAASANWHGVAQSLHLRDADPRADQAQLDRVTELYTHFRYRHGLGAELALAILHLRRPFLVPLFTAPLFTFYSPIASEIAREFASSTPMFWESIRRDLVTNTAEIQQLRARLAADDDAYGRSLALLSEVRLHCIIAQQLVDAAAGH
ncbi:hypothetical protein D6T64_08680 [Cryobacterium melibiosiphilum]|uniref:Uncharacterized protein n=1 Tax=Cryobacterium melibiosiphilum TaxID=995039 RepID=A0A3A5MUZ2_9MICO|nr:hypothetical protein [Cryobacterium melibiosiphilum]RJT89024.1 hypothetical protein D6T64_08680 [Cryobacterium melibiosiphilum]